MKARVVALALLAGGCDTVADGHVFEKKIEETLAKKGISLTADCPDKIPLGKVADNHFQCEVVMADTGERGTIEVELDAEGNLKWHPVGADPAGP